MRIGYLYQLFAGLLFFGIGLYFLIAGEKVFEGSLGEGWHKGFAYSDGLVRVQMDQRFFTLQKEKKSMKNWVFVIGVLALSLIACDDFSYVGKANDVPTAGRVKVGFDRGDSMMVVQWLEMFHAKYPQASIIPVFKETDELVEHWMKDSIQGVFLHKKFSQEELNWLEDKKNATINEVPMGTTSVVFITNPNSKINSIDFYSGQTNWNEVTIGLYVVRI
jgi:hypothetical protein